MLNAKSGRGLGAKSGRDRGSVRFGARSELAMASIRSDRSNTERFKSYAERMADMEQTLDDSVGLHLLAVPEATKRILGVNDEALQSKAGSRPSKLKMKPPPIGEKQLKPHKMRGIALVAHKSMKAALLEFIDEWSEELSRFILTVEEDLEEQVTQIVGAQSMGAALAIGELGGDSQIATQLVMEQVGCVIYFADPLTVSPFNVDTEALERLINVTNVLFASNPTSAIGMMEVLKDGVEGRPELIPSLFIKLVSPAVAEYKAQQDALIASLKERAGDKPAAPAAPPAAPVPAPKAEQIGEMVDAKKFVTFVGASTGESKAQKRVGQKLAEQSCRSVLHGFDPNDSGGVDGGGLDKPMGEKIAATDMRCLALISHNHMKPAMQDFVKENATVLRQFRLTGTDSTMKMLRSVLGEDAHFGPSCASGPLGGDAQVGAQLCLSDIGGVIFFTDPLSAHPHIMDVYALIRLVNIKNVLHATNTASAHSMIHLLGKALNGHPELIPSFFYDLTSPALVTLENNEAGLLEDSTRLSVRELKAPSQKKNTAAVDAFHQEMLRKQAMVDSQASVGSSDSPKKGKKKGKKAKFEEVSEKKKRKGKKKGKKSEGMDPTTRMLLIGGAVAFSSMMLATVGGIVLVGVQMSRRK